LKSNTKKKKGFFLLKKNNSIQLKLKGQDNRDRKTEITL
jgi:hypothetical protein